MDKLESGDAVDAGDDDAKKNAKKNIKETIIFIAAVFILYFIVHSFVFEVAVIDGNSMVPTLLNKEKVVVTKLGYIFGEPNYRDIIAFPYPSDKSRKFVKRVIGKSGDVIDVNENGVFINGERLDDDFAEEPGDATVGSLRFPLTVPEGGYFVLGDNRGVSKDSRYEDVGIIRRDSIIGRVSFRALPLSKIGALK
jgi:signal peptidase I